MWAVILLLSVPVIVIAGKCKATLGTIHSSYVGNTMTFTCTIDQCVNYNGPYPHPVSWYKSEEKLTTGVTSLKLTRNRTRSNLRMTLEKSDNNKVLRCSSPAADSVSAPLNVRYEPKITIEPATDPLVVREGEDVMLHCSVDSNPLAYRIRWNYFGVSQFYGANYTLTTDRYNSGVYECEARNTLGTTRAGIELKVEYGPTSVSLSPSSPHYDMTEGINEMPSITCSADCRPPCTYSWGSTRRSSAVLDLGEVDRYDAGLYTCRASNRISNMSSMSINVKVRYPPYIEFAGTKTRTEGANYLMRCWARGVPADFTFYEWYQVYDYGGPQVQSGNLTSSGEVYLSDLSYMHNGRYYCSFSNGVSTSSGQTIITQQMVRLTVEGPPHGIQSLYTKTGYLGSRVEFIVEFFQFTRSQKRMNVSWYNLTSGKVVTPKRSNITLKTMDFTTQFFSTNVTVVPGYRIVATIDDVTTWDFGRYVVYLQSVEQNSVLQLKVEREEVAMSDPVNGWMISCIAMLVVIIAGCCLEAVCAYRRGFFKRCGPKREDRPSEVQGNPDQTYNDFQMVDRVEYDPRRYAPLNRNPQATQEGMYINVQNLQENTYENLALKNSGQKVPEVADAGQQNTSGIYQNIDINTGSKKGNRKLQGGHPKQKKTTRHRDFSY